MSWEDIKEQILEDYDEAKEQDGRQILLDAFKEFLEWIDNKIIEKKKLQEEEGGFLNLFL